MKIIENKAYECFSYKCKECTSKEKERSPIPHDENYGKNFIKWLRQDPEYRKKENEKNKEYREQNKEKIAEYSKKYYEANKEIIADRKKQYHEANKETIAAQTKQYREENKQKILDRKKQYYEDNKEKELQRAKQWKEQNKEKVTQYGTEKITCVCGCEIQRKELSRHKKTAKHEKLMKTKAAEAPAAPAPITE